MIVSVIIGAIIGALLSIGAILWKWWAGWPTTVTASGWPIGPIRSGGWGMLIGAIVALIEVLTGTRLRRTWGLSIILSSAGGVFGGLAAWAAYTSLTSPPESK